MSRIYLISDVHLGYGKPEEEKRKIDLLSSLLHRVQDDATNLCIVGDLFDFWFEYKRVLPRGYHRILSELEALKGAGIEIDYLAGNHDFALGSFFSDDLGIAIHPDMLIRTWNDVRVYLYHGDGLAEKDGGYRLLKRVLRNRLSRFLFRWIHPDIGFALARLVSHTSRDYSSNKSYGKIDGQRAEAERLIRDGVKVVVMGHRHTPVLERIGSGIYLNPGDWLRHYTYAVFDGQRISLHSLIDNSEHSLTLE